jgi:hypothetical protein
MWAKITSPNTMFTPHKYSVTVLTDEDTATKLEGLGLTQVRDRSGQPKYEEPAFTFSRRAEKNDGTANPAPKLIDSDNNSLDVAVGNGSEVTVKIKPYSNNFGSFAELIAVKVDNLVEYAEADSDNEEF